MMLRMLIVGLLMSASGAQAMQPFHPTGLLPEPAARPLLEQHPQVAAARAGLEVARQEAGVLENSPYEWTAKLSNQRRSLQSGPRYREWNAGIERTIRLPGKATADRKIGRSIVEEAEARYGEALHEVARELAALWVDWLAAERAHALSAEGLQSMRDSLAAVEKRLRAGDASKLDLGTAQAELAEQRRAESEAATQANAAWARLSAYFPGLERQPIPLPVPLPIDGEPAAWRERILAESDELKVVQTQLRQAKAQAERARTDKMPDPTLGVFTASELGGQERISGVTISIPLPGGGRRARSDKAAAAITVSYQEVESKKRQLTAAIDSALETARGAYDSLQIANEGAAAMRDNAALTQRAYALGEAELQTLLLARRQANAASHNALQAQTTALKAYYGLLVDAHLVWDLAHD